MDLNKHFESFFSPDEINDMLSKYDDSDIESTKQMFNDQLREYGIDLEELERDFENYTPPKYNYVSDSGFDLHSVEDLEIPPFGRILVPTGLSFDIKDGYEIQVRSKSGLAIKQGLMVLNSPGTVDNGYTGEVQVIVFNTNNYSVTIPKGMKVGQAVLCPVVNGKWVNLTEQSVINEKERGENGFGSTGI